MSAFQQPAAHLAVIVAAWRIVNTPWHKPYMPLGEARGHWFGPVQHSEAAEERLFNELAAENVASLDPEEKGTVTPEEYDSDLIDRAERFLNALRKAGAVSDMLRATVAQAIDGYEYQACEHAGWGASRAQASLQVLRKELLKTIPEAHPDAWSFNVIPVIPV